MTKPTRYALVFLASFCLMVMELVAGRVIAPFVGTSIYTWTSIIGIFLLGITLGNWLGGKTADAYPAVKIFGYIFLASAVSTLLSIFLIPSWEMISKSNLWIPGLITFFSFLTFFPIAFFLSFTTPLAIKLELQKLDFSGKTVGNLYGISAAGSILGTFLTGFWLIPSFGTKQIIWGIFFILGTLGFIFLFKYIQKKQGLFILLILILPFGVLGMNKKNRCDKESQYYCIRLEKLVVEGTNQTGWALELDKLQHSHIYSPDFDPFGDGYVRIIATYLGYKFSPDEKLEILAIGGGGFVLPRYILNNYPNAKITVLEIDPQVTTVNMESLGLVNDPRMTIVHGDARQSINRFSENVKFDLIIGDAFNDFSVPFHLTTQEFLLTLRAHLTEQGSYLMNVVDDAQQGGFLSSSLLTVASVFPKTFLLPLNTLWYQKIGRATFVILGSNTSVDESQWEETRPLSDPLWEKAQPETITSLKTLLPMTSPGLPEFLALKHGIILTDNFAPVDNFLTSLYQTPF